MTTEPTHTPPCGHCGAPFTFTPDTDGGGRWVCDNGHVVGVVLPHGELDLGVVSADGAACRCGHHLNQHNGGTVAPDGTPVDSGRCVACLCASFDGAPLGPTVDGAGVARARSDDGVYPFEAAREHGLLWYINRVAFHPRGFALGFIYPPDADPAAIASGDISPVGWTITGDGTEPWAFGDMPDGGSIDDDQFARFEALLAATRARNGGDQ